MMCISSSEIPAFLIQYHLMPESIRIPFFIDFYCIVLYNIDVRLSVHQSCEVLYGKKGKTKAKARKAN